MKVLVLRDDYYHAKENMDPAIIQMSDNEYQFDLSLTSGDFENYDVIMFCKADRISKNDATPFMTDEYRSRFCDFVRNGGGLLCFHAGIAICDNKPDMLDMIGSYFVTHPKPLPVSFVKTKDHPITDGVNTFTETEEHYQIKMTCDDADVILKSVSDAGEQIGGYTRNY